MISLLEGILAEADGDGAVVLVGGVGYRAHMSGAGVARLPARGDSVRLHTHLHVREDALTLYGFATADERDLFELLLGVNGVGPKAALAILGMYAPDALRRAVAGEDLDGLTRVPGIGRKTAARLVIDLREKIGTAGDGLPEGARRDGPLADVREALVGLGYTPSEASAALRRLPPGAGGGSVEELVRLALKELASA